MIKQASLLTIGGFDPRGKTGIIADRNVLMGLNFEPVNIASGIILGPIDMASIDRETFERQLEVSVDIRKVQAIKTGILAKRGIIEAISTFLEDHKENLPHLVVDACVDANEETSMLTSGAISLLKMRLLPLATLTIAYLSEAERLAGIEITKVQQMKEAAEAIHIYGSKFVLIKADKKIENEQVDILYDGHEHQFLFTKNALGQDMRAARDIFSSGVAAYLAKNYRLKMAVESAKDLTTPAARLIGRERPA